MFKLRIIPGGITRIILKLAAIGFNESRNGPKVSFRDLASVENKFYLELMSPPWQMEILFTSAGECGLAFMGRWKLFESWHQDCACGNLLPAAAELAQGWIT